MQSTRKARLTELWMIPLGVLSFMLFRAARIVLAKLIERQTFRQSSYQPGWRPISGKTLQLKWYLPWMMTRAPRWNPHALIANAGPFEAKQRVRVRIADAYDSAQDWTVVLYSHPHYRMQHTIGPSADGNHPEWLELDVEPGAYTLSLRYYQLQPTLSAPAIEVDGKPFCPAQPLRRDTNDFYRTIAEHSNAFYRAMQFYIYVLLRFERWIDPGFLRRELLPVGNPNTQFVYGSHTAGQRIHIEIPADIFARCYSYVTIYETGSFPVAWWDLDAPVLLTERQPRAGFFLLRLCAKPGETLDTVGERITARADYPAQIAFGSRDIKQS